MFHSVERQVRTPETGSGPGEELCDAMVLCAGFGTRLAPLTDWVPKPLVPLGDRTLLAAIVSRLAAAGVRRVAINAHHLADQMRAAAEGLEVPSRVQIESTILGTAGGVKGVRPWLRSPVLIWNGDILAAPPIEDLLASARDTGGVCLAVAPRASGAGSVGLDHAGNLVRLRGEVFGAEHHGADYVGIAALGERCLSALADQGCLVNDVWLPWLRSGGRIETILVEGTWCDFGSLGSYIRGNLEWLGEHGMDVFLGAGASVEADVQVHHSVIGVGAHLVGKGLAERVVVWPGATLHAPASSVVALPDGRVVRVPATRDDTSGSV